MSNLFTLRLDKLLQRYVESWEASKASLIDVTVFLETTLQLGWYLEKEAFHEVITITDNYKTLLSFVLPDKQTEKLMKPLYNLTYTFANTLLQRTNVSELYQAMNQPTPVFIVHHYEPKTGLLFVECP